METLRILIRFLKKPNWRKMLPLNFLSSDTLISLRLLPTQILPTEIPRIRRRMLEDDSFVLQTMLVWMFTIGLEKQNYSAGVQKCKNSGNQKLGEKDGRQHLYCKDD